MNLIGEKYIKLQDAKFKLSSNNNNETGIFIDHELAEKLDMKNNSIFTFNLNKLNVVEALNYTSNIQMQLFLKKSIAILDKAWYENELLLIDSHFENTDKYHCNVSLESGNRFYLNGLIQENGFNVRNLLVEDHFKLKFFLNDEGEIFIEIITIPKVKESIDFLYKNSALRLFAFEVFKRIYNEFGGEFLELNFEEKHTHIGEFNYVGIRFPKYFGNSKLLGIFDPQQVKDIKSSKSRFRYQDEPLRLFIPDKNFYFTTEFEFNRSNESHLLFDDFRRFILDYSNGQYSVVRDVKGDYLLVSLFKENTVINMSNKTAAQVMPIQKIFFGSPGSGKSYHIKLNYPGTWPRITFHPELDYQGFVGAYKPVMIRNSHGEQMSYRFIAEAFVKAYCKAWESDAPYYLIIEEINRGNCAQIFGDIFQLLDRGIDGFSQYPVSCSQDVQEYLSANLKLTKRISEYIEKTGSDDFSSLSLPNNLNIICSMNTSDQSLFPMDSAFKRRWDWHYIPIDYNDANKFEIDLGIGKSFNWGAFIKGINEKIREHTQSEDKQIGNRFVSTGSFNISAEQFVYKVIFYLWSEIYKDEHLSGNTIFYIDQNKEITYSDFFNDSEIDLEITRKFIVFNLNYTGLEIKNNNIAYDEIEHQSIEKE